MKIFLICSKRFYNRIAEIEARLKELGHVVTMPTCYDDPGSEDRYKKLGAGEHAKWKGGMFQESADIIRNIDAVLVLNFNTDKTDNYIGGATFLEMYDAFRLGKKIYLHNPVPEGILQDEILGFSPIVIDGDMSRIR